MITPLRLAQLVETSYTATPTWANEWPDGRVRAQLVEEDGYSVVLFPGTANVLDWFVDFRALPATVKDYAKLGRCHEGFVTALDKIGDRMIADLAGKQIVVAGHSLGGALAQLFAGALAALGHPPLGLCTFGAAGCMADDNDLLPTLLETIPIAGGLLDLRHRDDPVPFALPGFDRRPRPKAWTQLVPMWLELDFIEDHLLGSYIGALQGSFQNVPV